MSALSTLSGLVDSAAATNGLKKNDAKELNDRFLKLLVAQLNNQDPLNPLDNAQVTSQMAQINTVTGINGLNDTVGKLLEQFARLETMQAAQLTGRDVLVDGNAITLGASGAAIGGVELAAPADSVTVQIRDANGLLVRELSLGAMSGMQKFEWDGKTTNDTPAAAGQYTFSVQAVAGGKEVGSTALAARRVEGVRQEGGAVQLILTGAGAVAYGDIKQIL
ncbi:MAG TPA: flagellar hook assembly protein FlgD [Burkholderiaceae bacterium]|nr:flagellar hook assembly protein FlgD [Burkholderiaceae bacterium]